MPDVGILNLQIHDDSAKAAEGLSTLVAKLGEMKEATSKIRLGTVATGIKRINDELSKVQPSAIYKLKQLADVLDRIGSISGNVGGIRISFGGRGQNAEDMAAQLQAARDAVAQTTAGFEQIGQRVQEDVQGAEAFANTMGRVNEIVQQTGWTAQATAEQFSRMFQVMNSMRMSRSLGAGTNPFALGDGTGGSGADWTYWKDGAIEVEGYVDDISTSMNRLEGTVDGVSAKLYSSTSESVESAMEQIKMLAMQYETEIGRLYSLMFDESGATRVGIDVEGLSKQIEDYDSRISELAEKYKELESISETSDMAESFAQTSEAVDEVRDSFERTTSAVQDYDDAIEFARKWNASGASASGYNGQESADIEYVNNLIQSASQADLLTMRIDALRDKLYQMAGSGKYTGDQIARMVSQIHGLQEKLDKLNSTTEDVKKSFFELMAESGGLSGAFKRMFPTISGLLTRFKQIVKYRMLRAVIKQIAEGFREGTENYYRYSQAIGGEFATKMDNAATALLQMKNSIGAAAAPLINSLIPYLQMAVDWFINIVNYANQFVALLRGQTTWSRAVPKTTKAFEDQTKAAKKTGAAIKDLLADWDELNIIQSESGGGGGVGGTSAAEDYLNMFEEVKTFDERIKKIVDYIKENFETIKLIAEAIGAAILLWKLSNAFEGAIGRLKSLSVIAGLVLVIKGIQMTADSGYDIGKNGINGQNAMEAVKGVLLTMLGGGLVGLGIGGIAGGLIGITVGAFLTLTILQVKLNQGHLDSLYGDIHKDAEEIRTELRENILTTSAKLKIEILTAKLKDVSDAEAKVSTALSELEKSYPVGVDITTDNAEDFREKVNALVDATNAAIKENAETTKEIYVPATAAFTSNFVDEAWGHISSYVTELGRRIGEALDQGITDNTTLDDLRNKLLNISREIMTAGKQGEFSSQVGILGTKVRENNFGNYDRETVQNYMKGYDELIGETRSSALGYATAEAAELEKLIRGLEVAIEQGEGIVTSEEMENMKRDLEAAKAERKAKFGENGEKIIEYVESLVEEWTAGGRTLYESDIMGAVSNAMVKNKNYMGQRDLALNYATYGTGVNDDEWVEKYLASNRAYLIGAIAQESGMDESYVKKFIQYSGIDPLSFFDAEFVEQYRNKIVNWLAGSELTDTQKAKVLSSVGLNFEDINWGEVSRRIRYAQQEQGFSLIYTPPTEQYVADAWVDNAKKQPTFSLAYQAPVDETVFDWFDTDEMIEEAKKKARETKATQGAFEDEAKGHDGNVFKRVYDDIVEWWQNSPFAYKPPQELTENMVVKIDDAGVVIEDPDGLRQELENQVNYLLKDSRLEDWERNALNQTYGEELVRQVLNDLQYTFDEEGYLTGNNVTRLQRLASTGNLERTAGGMGVSDVGWNPSGLEFEAEMDNGDTDAQMQTNIESGAKRGTQDMLGVLRDLLNVAQAISRKEFRVTITPTSTLGATMSKSMEKYGMVTGED